MKPYICKIHGEVECYEHTATRRGVPHLVHNCKQCVKDRAKASSSKNPEHTKTRIKRWMNENRDRYLSKKRDYYSEHKDALNQQVRQWKKDNPKRVYHHNTKRKAAKRNAQINDLTMEQWQEILVEHEHKCAYCGRSDVPMTMDHIVPLSKGGLHTKENITTACMSCNSGKKDKSKEEYERIKKSFQPS